MQMEPGGFISLAERLIATGLRRDVAADLGELKELLERRTAQAGAVRGELYSVGCED